MLLTVQGGAVMVKEVERRIKVTDGIIRHITVRVDEELRKADRRKAQRAKDDEQKKSRATTRTETGYQPEEAQ